MERRAALAGRAGRSEPAAAGHARRNAVAPSSATPAPEQVAQSADHCADDLRSDAAGQARSSCRARAWQRPSRARPKRRSQPRRRRRRRRSRRRSRPNPRPKRRRRLRRPPRRAPVTRPPRAGADEPSPSLLDRVNQYWWVLVLLGLLVVIGSPLAFVRRRREEAARGCRLDGRPWTSSRRADARRAGDCRRSTKARDRDSFVVEDSDDDDALGGLR